MIEKKILSLGFILLLGSYAQESAAQVKKIKTIVVDAGHGGTDSGAPAEYENSLKSFEKDITLAISLKLVDELKKQLPDLNIIPTRTTDVFDSPTEKARIANEAQGDLFVCIHADSQPLKTGSRQIGTKMVTKYKVRYEGKGKNKKKITESYEVEVPIYESFKMSGPANGTSVYIFNPTKISDRLKAIKNDEFEPEFEKEDTTIKHVDYTTPEGRILANAYSKLYLAKADLAATLVLDEIAKTGRKTLGVKQRPKGIWVLSATKMPSILIETGFVSNEEDEKYLTSEEGQNEIVLAIAKAIKQYRDSVEEKK
jgi:N-acetylmuramoyl-L-alanine amidase